MVDVNNIYHDKEIIGYSFRQFDKELTFEIKNGEKLKFERVVQFELNFVSDQNVITDIYSWISDDIPIYLVDDYPFLKNFIKTKTKCYYIDSSVGLSGIIICQYP